MLPFHPVADSEQVRLKFLPKIFGFEERLHDGKPERIKKNIENIE